MAQIYVAQIQDGLLKSVLVEIHEVRFIAIIGNLKNVFGFVARYVYSKVGSISCIRVGDVYFCCGSG